MGGEKKLALNCEVTFQILKGVKHPAHSGRLQLLKLKEFFVLTLGLQLQKYSTNAKRYSHKKFLETLGLFFRPEFSEKEGFYQS